jgi:hypothetical protein
MQQSKAQAALLLPNDSLYPNSGGSEPSNPGGPISCIPCINEKTMKWITWGGRVVVFLVYFSMSIALAANLRNRPGCLVQHTYHQEFLANVVSNPMYTSSAIMRNAPVSMLESDYYNATEIHQRTSDIAVFPNVLLDPVEHAAFLSVLPGYGVGTCLGRDVPSERRARVRGHDQQLQDLLHPVLQRQRHVHGDLDHVGHRLVFPLLHWKPRHDEPKPWYSATLQTSSSFCP